MRKSSRKSFIVALALIAVSCRPQLVVRLATRVFHDGSLSRTLEVEGRTDEGEEPTDDNWLSKSAGVRLASPDAWDRVDRSPGRLRAEGFFARHSQLPGLLAFDIDAASRSGGFETRLVVEDRLIAKRWLYVEKHGDPFGPEARERALSALTDLVAHALNEELRHHFGADLNTAPAETVLRDEGRPLAAALIAAGRKAPGWVRSASRVQRWSEILTRAGLPVATAEADEFWDEQTPLILAWARDRVAASLSTPEQPIRPDDLSFWPVSDDPHRRLEEIMERVWGDTDELADEVMPHLSALAGYYGADSAPRLRFEARLSLPGVLLRTNGTPAGDSVVWVFREQELNYTEVVLEAESVELQAEPLTVLGARRELEPAALVRLADVLWKQDPQRLLERPLREAVESGSFDPLRNEDLEPVEMLPLARELADLLDPDVPLKVAPTP